MRTYVQAEGWYSDITLEGDRVSLIRDSHINVNGNVINLPEGQNVLFLVCKRWNGQILLVGQDGDKDNTGRSITWLYKDGEWKNIGKSFATFPCTFGGSLLYFVSSNNQYQIYDLDDDSISDPINRTIGSNGIRYIDFEQSPDGIMTGDATYGPYPYQLSQWIKRDNLVLGQSYQDGGVGLVDGSYRKFISGSTEFIRYYRSGNNLAFCCVNQPEKFSSFFWMTLDEFKQFPIVTDGKSKPPVDNPIPEPPTGEPKMPLAPNQLVAVQRMIRLHLEVDTLDEEERGKILDYVIKSLGGSPWGRKARNKDGSNKNTDALCYLLSTGQFEIYDVISGGDGSATWDYQGTFSNGENGYWAEGNPVEDGEIKPPADNPLPVDNSSLVKRVKILEEALSDCLRYGQEVGLMTRGNFVLCAEGMGVPEEEANSSVKLVGNVNATRKGVGHWETFKLVKP